MAKVGILALQGDFAEHQAALSRMGQESCQVRLPHHLDGADALIIPGGESTTLARLMDIYSLREPVLKLASKGVPIWGTCAGLIMLAQQTPGIKPQVLGLMDIHVVRNAFGRQVDSFEADLEVKALGPAPFRAVFIRAPIISNVGPGVEVLSTLEDGQAVAARQKNLLATAFHPELTPDYRFHQYFLRMISSSD